jgi:hypothetical protein
MEFLDRKIFELDLGVSVIRSQGLYQNGGDKEWYAVLKYTTENVEVSGKSYGPTMEGALLAAWEHLAMLIKEHV